MMKRPIMIASMHSGAGKTSISLGIIKYLIDNSISVRAYKTGPDYIDTKFHSEISNKACINLEPYFLEAKDGKLLRKQYKKYDTEDISIIEASMAYYDGIYGFEPRASAYTVANATNARVCLLVDEFDIERINEYIHRYDNIEKTRIEAIILNKADKKIYKAIKKMIEEKCGVRVLGYLEEKKDLKIASRHLGLKMPEEINIQNIASKIKNSLIKTCDMSFFLEKRLKIGISKDEAFCFLYEENINLLKEEGFEIVYFSPLRDKDIPNDLAAIFLCGGYPELYAKKLEENIEFKKNLLLKLKSGLPFIAECGGFMYLHNSLEGIDNKKYKMLGFFDFDAYRTDKLQRFGYIEIRAKKDNILLKKDEVFRSHEFHHWDSANSGCSCIATKANKSKTWECIHSNENMFAGFPHIYFAGNKNMLKNLKRACKKYRKEQNGL